MSGLWVPKIGTVALSATGAEPCRCQEPHPGRLNSAFLRRGRDRETGPWLSHSSISPLSYECQSGHPVPTPLLNTSSALSGESARIGCSSSAVDISKASSTGTSSTTTATDLIDHPVSYRLSRRTRRRRCSRTSILHDSIGWTGSAGLSVSTTWSRDVDGVLSTHSIHTEAEVA